MDGVNGYSVWVVMNAGGLMLESQSETGACGWTDHLRLARQWCRPEDALVAAADHGGSEAVEVEVAWRVRAKARVSVLDVLMRGGTTG